MEWIERLNAAINYIEMHLTDEIDPAQLGRIACCSPYHFQRMFGYMAEQPLSEYIRRRKMSVAATELQAGSQKVIDIAAKYGYSSPTAFNRAFQAVHGVAPSAVKKQGATIKSFPPLVFKMTVKGTTEMNYRIETKDEIRIVGVSVPISHNIEENFQTLPAFWDSTLQDGTVPRLLPMMDGAPKGLLGICFCNETEGWRYYIAVASTQPKGAFEERTIPAATWAVFSGGGANTAIQELERRILTEWLPTSGYEYGSAPDMEVYISPDPQNAKFEVWIPVVKK